MCCSCWFFSLLVLLLYSSSLHRLLSSSSSTAESLLTVEQLLDQPGAQFGTVHWSPPSSLSGRLLSSSTSPTSLTAGVRRVLSADQSRPYHLLLDSLQLDQLDSDQRCRLVAVGQLGLVRHRLWFRRGSRLGRRLSLALLQLEEAGRLDRMVGDWRRPPGGGCDWGKEEEDGHRPFGNTIDIFTY